jgi:hypothetical protein
MRGDFGANFTIGKEKRFFKAKNLVTIQHIFKSHDGEPNQALSARTVIGRDADVEPLWMDSRRVLAERA